MKEPTLILVTGQHRSGTSATAGCLERLGVFLGTMLMPANESNPRGYFEDVRVVKVHDALLEALGASWDRPGDVPATWQSSPAAESATASLSGILREFVARAPLFAVKDPRAALFLPAWIEACQRAGARLTVLVPRRKPEAVVNSLVTREGWDPGRAEEVVRGYARMLDDERPCGLAEAEIDFPDELWQASRWERVARLLGVELDTRRIGEVHAFLDYKLVHHG